MIRCSARSQQLKVLVARDAAQVFHQTGEIANHRQAILCAEDDMDEVERVGVGHELTVFVFVADCRDIDHRVLCRR